MTDLSEPQVSVTFVQGYSILSARGKHAVGLGDTLCDEIVDHYTDKCLPS